MGVSGFWKLLEPTGQEINLEDCNGKKLAVDLSTWIVQCSSVATSANPSYLCCRGIFLRTLNLLSLGISLVFVMDGPSPPAVKKKTKRREDFYHLALGYKELLTAMGIPVIESVGEAEKLCAELNNKKFVDGVITNDGDALIYGAQTVYKGLLQDKKEQKATVYHMEEVTKVLDMTRNDLVAYALLSGGDFSDGVKNIGGKKFCKLKKEFKKNKIQDALDRINSWSSNAELDSLDTKKISPKIKRKHCTKCLHIGTIDQHKRDGCSPCQADTECREVTTPDHLPCPCEFHILEEAVKPYQTELKLRQLALKTNPNFPEQAVVQEFLEPLPQSLTDFDLSQRVPDFRAVCAILKKRLKFEFPLTMSYLVPAIIKMTFYGLLPDLSMSPKRIIKTCKNNRKQCFEIEWQRIDDDNITNKTGYNIKLSQNLFTTKYPEIVEQFMSLQKSGLKRKHDDLKQTKLTSIFKVVKDTQTQK